LNLLDYHPVTEQFSSLTRAELFGLLSKSVHLGQGFRADPHEFTKRVNVEGELELSALSPNTITISSLPLTMERIGQ
jgi:hypothetical protein